MTKHGSGFEEWLGGEAVANKMRGKQRESRLSLIATSIVQVIHSSPFPALVK